MSKTARQLVERAGLDVDVLNGKLAAAAGGELAAFHCLTIISSHSIGVTDDQVKEVVRDIRAEARIHYGELVKRIHELDGSLPADIHGFMQLAGQPETYLPQQLGGQDSLLTSLLRWEQHATHLYRNICDFTAGKDHRTHELALAMLTEEIEHQTWIQELSGETVHARFRPGFRGRAPYVTGHHPADPPDPNAPQR